MASGGLNALAAHGDKAQGDKALLLQCSIVAQNFPWSVRSPQGEFLRERGKLKIVALGSRVHSLCLGPWPALSLWSQIEPNDAILEQLRSPSLKSSNSPFFPLAAPSHKKTSDQLGGGSLSSGARAEVWEISEALWSPPKQVCPPRHLTSSPSPCPSLRKLQVQNLEEAARASLRRGAGVCLMIDTLPSLLAFLRGGWEGAPGGSGTTCRRSPWGEVDLLKAGLFSPAEPPV